MGNSHKNQSHKNIIGAIVMAILFICIIAVIATGFIFKSKNSTPSIFGKSIYIMNGTGMEPRIPDKSAVFAVKGKLPEIGDAALCNIVDNELTTILGVYGIEETDEGINYIMKSDTAPNTQLISVPEDKVIGKADQHDEFLGKAILFVTSKAGMIVLVVLPAAIIIILYLLRVLRKINIDESEYETPYEDYDDEDEIIDEDEDEDDEPEIVEQVSQPVPVVVDAKGEAQYEEKKPVKSVKELDSVLFIPQTKKQNPQEKPSAPKSFEFKATAEDIKKVTKPQFEKEKVSDKQMNVYIPPKTVSSKPKKSSNQTLEELMKMLDKKEKEIKK